MFLSASVYNTEKPLVEQASQKKMQKNHKKTKNKKPKQNPG